MNRLQRLRTRQTYCVTLNRQAALAAGSVLHEVEYTHPYYDFRALDTQPELPSLNGVRHTYYCGSYFRWGFHEDAVASAVAAARALGAEL
jgi:predicted NAD/FAD-binding protein